jgi:hypothetical protein
MIPIPPQFIGLALRAAFVAAIAVAAFTKGCQYEARKHQEQQARALAAAVQIRERQREVTERVVYQYVDRWHEQQERVRVIRKEVPTYVTVASDSACHVPLGFVWLHDGAAADRVPEPAGDPDASAAGVTLSAIADTVAGNYGICHSIRAQLISLQAWAAGIADADQ